LLLSLASREALAGRFHVLTFGDRMIAGLADSAAFHPSIRLLP